MKPPPAQYVPPEKAMIAPPRAWGGFDGYRLMPLEEAAAAEEEKVCGRAAALAEISPLSYTLTTNDVKQSRGQDELRFRDRLTMQNPLNAPHNRDSPVCLTSLRASYNVGQQPLCFAHTTCTRPGTCHARVLI